MELADVNVLAVGVAALLSFGLGAIWYSPLLCGNAWMAANGYTAADVPRLQAGAKVNYAISFVAWFLMALVLALVGPHFGDGILDLLHIGVLLWLGFAASVGVTNNRFSEKPISAWVIDAGYQLASIVIMAVVLGLWR